MAGTHRQGRASWGENTSPSCKNNHRVPHMVQQTLVGTLHPSDRILKVFIHSLNSPARAPKDAAEVWRCSGKINPEGACH